MKQLPILFYVQIQRHHPLLPNLELFLDRSNNVSFLQQKNELQV